MTRVEFIVLGLVTSGFLASGFLASGFLFSTGLVVDPEFSVAFLPVEDPEEELLLEDELLLTLLMLIEFPVLAGGRLRLVFSRATDIMQNLYYT
tara:strand:+ start:499 stop:780 length:282 start_codon:yes stop_codon:yes gene_type:complete